MNKDKKFFEYTEVNGHPCMNEVTCPHCPMGDEDPITFLVYADDKETAFKLAMNHKYGTVPLRPFYGTYKGERYHGEIKCAM